MYLETASMTLFISSRFHFCLCASGCGESLPPCCARQPIVYVSKLASLVQPRQRVQARIELSAHASLKLLFAIM